MSERKGPGKGELEPAGEALRRALQLMRTRRRVDAPRLVSLSHSFRAAAVGRFPRAPQVHESAGNMGTIIQNVQSYEAKNAPELARREQLRAAVGEEQMTNFQTLLQTTTEQAQTFTTGIIEDGWGVTVEKNIDWAKSEDPPILHFLKEMSAALIAANHQLTQNGVFSKTQEDVPLIADEIVQSSIDESKRLAAEQGNPELILTEFDYMRDRIWVLTDAIEAGLKEPTPDFNHLRRQFLILMRHQLHFAALLGAYRAWMFISTQVQETRLNGIHFEKEDRTCRAQDALSIYLTTVASGERIQQRLMTP